MIEPGKRTDYSDDPQKSELETAENLMYRDAPLTPKMISSLMHVDASVQNTYYHASQEKVQKGNGALYVIGVLFLSLLLAGAIGTSFLYFHGIGPFYDPREGVSL